MSEMVDVVTGAAGLLGRNFIKGSEGRLDGCQIIALDPKVDLVRKQFGSHVISINGSSVDILKLAEHYKIRRVFHFGGAARISASFQNPEEVLENNISNSLPVLELWRRTKCLLIYASSSSVFSEPLKKGGDHDSLSPYSLSKDFMARLIKNYSLWYELRYRNAYLYNVYGKNELRSVRTTVIESMLDCRRKAKSLLVSKPGSQRRVFTHVDDAVRALNLAANENRDGDYHIGSNDVRSLLELAHMIGGPIDMIEAPLSARDVTSVLRPDLRPRGWDATCTVESFIDQELRDIDR